MRKLARTVKSLVVTVVLCTPLQPVAAAQGFPPVFQGGRVPFEFVPRALEVLLFEGAIADFNYAFVFARDSFVDLGLDRSVNVRLESCDGIEDGWDLNIQTIRICRSTVRGLVRGGIQRQLLIDAGAYDELRRRFASRSLKAGGSPSLIIAFLLAHELAHAIIDLWNIAVPGNGEIAADELAAVLLLENTYHNSESDYGNAVTFGAGFLSDVGELEDLGRALKTRHGSSEQRAHRLRCLSIGAHAAHAGLPKVDIMRGAMVMLDSMYLDPTPMRFRECIDGYDRIVRVWFELLTPSVYWGGGTDHVLPPLPSK